MRLRRACSHLPHPSAFEKRGAERTASRRRCGPRRLSNRRRRRGGHSGMSLRDRRADRRRARRAAHDRLHHRTAERPRKPGGVPGAGLNSPAFSAWTFTRNGYCRSQMPESSTNGARSSTTKEGKSAPSLRDAFDAFERPIARGSVSWIGSDVFMDGYAITWRLGRRLNAEARRGLDMWFGAWHLPTRSDVDRLSGQIAALERQVRDLRTELEQSDPPSLRLGKIPRRRPVSRGPD